MFIRVKPLAERKLSRDQVIARLRGKLGARARRQPLPATGAGHPHGRAQGNAQYQYTLQADDLANCGEWEPRIRQALMQLPQLGDVNTDSQDKGDRPRSTSTATRLRSRGITRHRRDAERPVRAAPGSTIYTALNQYRVVMEAAPAVLAKPRSTERRVREQRRLASRCRCRRSPATARHTRRSR
jgi:multidrug efflux pump